MHRREYGHKMNENQLLKLWYDQRSGRIRAQMAPTLLLAVILALALTGHLSNKSDVTLRTLTMGIVAASGIFSLISIFSALRESISLISALEEIKGLTLLGKDIRNSISSLTITGFAHLFFSLFNFVVLGAYLYRR